MNPTQYHGTSISGAPNAIGGSLNGGNDSTDILKQGLKNKTRSGVAWLSGETDPALLAAGASSSNKHKEHSGGFASFGLEAAMLDTLSKTLHFNQPTPIQRKAIPLLMQGSDIVAMARTGSGKTAAFCIPMIHRLKEHSPIVGMRGCIFSPTRELALQTLRHFRLLSKHTNLKSTALTGGDGLNAQFEAMAENPDIVVASPGRLLHVAEEVNINLLARVQVCVLDEADRLFEMGFQAQIVALIRKVPERAQRCLFSATMPTILAEFTEAGLHNPVVVRLDSETKISNSLKHGAFICRGDEKYGALIYLLTKWVKVPSEIISTNTATAEPIRKKIHPAAIVRNKKRQQEEEEENSDEEYVGDNTGAQRTRQVLIFVESKYHVEFIGDLLPNCYGIKTAAIHGSMDQEARRDSIALFRKKLANVLVVTDVAARGIDLPNLDYIINFQFPHEPKLFVHRVGRVARAGRQGVAYSILTQEDMPYYFDCMQFIGKKTYCRRPKNADSANSTYSADDGCYGRIPTHQLQAEVDTLSKLVNQSVDLSNLFGVTKRAHEKYTRTKKRATHEGMSASHDNEALRYENIPVHPMIEETLDENTKNYHNAVTSLRGFKAKETLLDMIHGEQSFKLDAIKYANHQKQKQRDPANNSEVIGRTETQIDEDTFDPLDDPDKEVDPYAKDTVPRQFTTSNNQHASNKKSVYSNEDTFVHQRSADTSSSSTFRKLTAEILGGQQEKFLKEQEQKRNSKPSLAERMSMRAMERKATGTVSSSLLDPLRRRQRDNGGDENGENNTKKSALDIAVRPMFADDAAENNNNDDDNNMMDSDDDDNNDMMMNNKNKKSSRDSEFYLPTERQETIDSQHLSLRGHAMDISAESAEEAKQLRSVFAWNNKKNRYIKMHVNDAKAMVKGIKNEAGKAIDFKSKLDAYKNWMKSSNMRIQDVGEQEDFTKLRLHQEARTMAEDEANGGTTVGDNNGDDDIDQSLVDDPKHKQKARLGRKMKKLPKEGQVKNFEQLSLEKRRRKKDAEKLEKRKARRAGRTGMTKR